MAGMLALAVMGSVFATALVVFLLILPGLANLPG